MALIVLMVVLVLGVSAFVVSAAKYLDPATLDRNHNARVLQQAKAALIGHVATQVLDLSNDFPGRLPCPEAPGSAGGPNEGVRSGTCDPAFPVGKNIGRFPWRSLGIEKLVDAANEPLWYAVSPNWANNGSTPPPINPGTAGQFAVDGVTDVVAVIIAPGRPLNTNPTAAQVAAGCAPRRQVRNDRAHNETLTAPPDLLDYLECQNATPFDNIFGATVVDNAVNPVSNDQIITITARDIMNAIQGPLAERLQRTVAPLLSEFRETWPSGNFLPYAAPFTAPEANLAIDSHCGPAASSSQYTEGLLPVAPSSGSCSSAWNVTIAGAGINPTGCTSDATEVNCSFRYYRITALGTVLALLGGGTTSLTASVQAVAPHAAASFRSPLSVSDLSLSPGAPTAIPNGFSFEPQTDGDARLSFNIQVNGTTLCRDDLLGSLPLVGPVTCFLLYDVLGLAEAHDVTVRFPQLSGPILQGTKLQASVLQGHTAPYNFALLSPSPGDPHFWFMQNEWYRYTYYAVSDNASAAATPGAYLTVNGFPADYGNANDKRFVLTLMGPSTVGQNRGPSATLAQYVEGDNAATGATPRQFAYQVFKVSGNDRIATCPYRDGATGPQLCD